ncbi:MAG: hypothetical protein EB127_27960, partial [Alphaproteobacteria bacterium]|nr:hypothetical protein [Alphaproteobacteria bacterium]
YETETFIIYIKNGQLWYIDTLNRVNAKINIKENQPWNQDNLKPNATITVLVRSSERAYVKTNDDKKRETDFKLTYDTSYIRTFTEDQLFEVDAYTNLTQRILIKNLKTDIFRRNNGHHVVYNKIESPYMLHVYNLTLNGIEHKYYLFGEYHHDPAPVGHCNTATPSPRFFQLIKELMKNSPSFFDLFIEEGITKEVGTGNLRRWNVYKFTELIEADPDPLLPNRVTNAFASTLLTSPCLFPELKEISMAVEPCFPGNPPNNDCKLIRSHYVDNRTVYNLSKYNILFFWLFAEEIKLGSLGPTTGSMHSAIYALIYETFKLEDFFKSMKNNQFEWIPKFLRQATLQEQTQ